MEHNNTEDVLYLRKREVAWNDRAVGQELGREGTHLIEVIKVSQSDEGVEVWTVRGVCERLGRTDQTVITVVPPLVEGLIFWTVDWRTH